MLKVLCPQMVKSFKWLNPFLAAQTHFLFPIQEKWERESCPAQEIYLYFWIQLLISILGINKLATVTDNNF